MIYKSVMRKTLASFVMLSMLSCVEAPKYRGEKSNHFDGNVFSNTEGDPDHGFLTMLKLGWQMTFQKEEWPEKVPVEKIKISEPRVFGNRLKATFINHSTVLVQTQGKNILTDPIWSERASPFTWAGPKRVIDPAVDIQDLPDIDVIVISHNHYDHLDVETLKYLQTHNSGEPPLLLAGLGNGLYFEELGLKNYKDLDWGDSEDLGEIKITLVETKHRSGRGILDQMATLWGGYVFSTSGGNIYFGGDTGYGKHFKATGAEFGPFRFSMIPIGAYEPRWFMKAVHTNPEEALQAHIDLGSKNSMGIHFGTFQLTLEKREEPIERLEKSRLNTGISEQEFYAPQFGGVYEIPPLPSQP
jgi:L-ascorbate metabolism protein UlaG (beta-lactamase superfamily)